MNFGILGLLLVVVSWLPEIRKTFNERKIRDLDIRFVTLYFLGSVLLFIHALKIGDSVFAILNLLLATMSMIQIVIIKVKR